MEYLEKQKCLLCGGVTKLMTSEQKGYLESDIFSIYYCSNCNTSFSIPRVDAGNIYELIYNKGEKVPAYDRYWKYAKDIIVQKDPFYWLANKEPIYWGVYDTIMNQLNVSEDARILEIGSGLGYLTYALRRAGFCRAFGWDISSEAVDNAKTRFGDYYECKDLYKEKDSCKNTFDIVILTEVIEHVENPIEFIFSILEIIKDDGCIILTTPNKSFYPDNAIWITDLPPVHCWWFSEKSFEFLSKEMNFKFRLVDYTSFYKGHEKILFDTKRSEQLYVHSVFDQSGKLISNMNKNSNTEKVGVFPKWVKKTLIYKKISRKVWPLLFNRFIVSGEKTDTQCVIIMK